MVVSSLVKRSLEGRLQLTFSTIKPQILKYTPSYRALRSAILAHGFYVVRSRVGLVSRAQAELLYSEHAAKFFHTRLLNSVTCGPSECLLLAKQSAIQDWRQLMGTTKCYQAQFAEPFSLRGRFGFTDTVNAVHGCDSEQSLERELNIFFPEFELVSWLDREESHFRHGRVSFDPGRFVHYVDESWVPRLSTKTIPRL